jgi:hypothetical protein
MVKQAALFEKSARKLLVTPGGVAMPQPDQPVLAGLIQEASVRSVSAA